MPIILLLLAGGFYFFAKKKGASPRRITPIPSLPIRPPEMPKVYPDPDRSPMSDRSRETFNTAKALSLNMRYGLSMLDSTGQISSSTKERPTTATKQWVRNHPEPKIAYALYYNGLFVEGFQELRTV
ncbi:MAG: hypothetical protein WC763_07185 [Candidatus Paceibacterota bacterium]|jgi:hypothetical protein